MNKSSRLKQIQKRLPEGIVVVDQTTFEFTDDEFIGTLSWIKYFNEHCFLNGKKELPKITFPIISKRLRLEFDLYRFPSDVEPHKGKHVIYLSQNGKLLNGLVKKNLTIKDIVTTWKP